jgi:hypothetical protein
MSFTILSRICGFWLVERFDPDLGFCRLRGPGRGWQFFGLLSPGSGGNLRVVMKKWELWAASRRKTHVTSGLVYELKLHGESFEAGAGCCVMFMLMSGSVE